MFTKRENDFFYIFFGELDGLLRWKVTTFENIGEIQDSSSDLFYLIKKIVDYGYECTDIKVDFFSFDNTMKEMFILYPYKKVFDIMLESGDFAYEETFVDEEEE